MGVGGEGGKVGVGGGPLAHFLEGEKEIIE